MEEKEQILDEMKKSKRPTWLTIGLEILRVIIAALAGSSGAAIL